jgi:hypothetical protein
MRVGRAALGCGLALALALGLAGCGPSENVTRHFGTEEAGGEAGSAEPLSTPPIASLRPPLAPGTEAEGQVSAPPPGLTEQLLAAPGQAGGAIIQRGSTSWLGSLF